MKLPLRLAGFACLALLTAACGAAGPERPAAAPAAATSAAPKPALAESLFSKDISGSLTEADLQKVLDAEVDLALPARIGVVALEHAFDPADPAPVGARAIVAKAMTDGLKGSRWFSSVTDISTELPNPSGVEGLRTIAARYRSRYLLLCSSVTEDRSHLNNWAWLYATGVGVLLAPGQTVKTEGYVQASLMDVKTGTVLYTVIEPFRTSSVTWLIGGERQQRQNDAREVAKATERLSKKVLLQTEQLERWAEREKKRGASTG